MHEQHTSTLLHCDLRFRTRALILHVRTASVKVVIIAVGLAIDHVDYVNVVYMIYGLAMHHVLITNTEYSMLAWHKDSKSIIVCTIRQHMTRVSRLSRVGLSHACVSIVLPLQEPVINSPLAPKDDW